MVLSCYLLVKHRAKVLLCFFKRQIQKLSVQHTRRADVVVLLNVCLNCLQTLKNSVILSRNVLRTVCERLLCGFNYCLLDQSDAQKRKTICFWNKKMVQVITLNVRAISASELKLVSLIVWQQKNHLNLNSWTLVTAATKGFSKELKMIVCSLRKSSRLSL